MKTRDQHCVPPSTEVDHAPAHCPLLPLMLMLQFLLLLLLLLLLLGDDPCSCLPHACPMPLDDGLLPIPGRQSS